MARRLVISKYQIVAVMLYMITFLSFNIDYFPAFQYIKYVIIAIVAIYLFSNYKSFLTSENVRLNAAISLFCAYVLIASFINRGTLNNRNSFLAAIVFVAIFMEVFFFMQIMGKKNLMGKILNLFYVLTLLWIIVIDFLAIFRGSLFKQYHNYIVGTKFEVCYLHIILLVLLFNRIKNGEYSKFKGKLISILLILLSVFMAITVNCNTGIIGIIIIVLFHFRAFNIQQSLMKPTTLLIAMLLPILFAVFFETILLNGAIQNFIINVLHRSLTLTGRTLIYQKLPSILSGHYIFGYGYGSSYEICKHYTGFADTQNGLLEWVLQIGIPGTILLVSVCYFTFKKISESKNTGMLVVTPLVILIYVFIILGTVEITIGMFYFGLMALIYGCSIEHGNYRRKTEDVHEK